MPGQAFEWDHGLGGPRCTKVVGWPPVATGTSCLNRIIRAIPPSRFHQSSTASAACGTSQFILCARYMVISPAGSTAERNATLRRGQKRQAEETFPAFVPGRATQLHEHRQKHFAGEISHSLQMHEEDCRNTGQNRRGTDMSRAVASHRRENTTSASSLPATHAEFTTASQQHVHRDSYGH